MIVLKAVLLCETIRIEVDGTLTVIGMYNDRLVAPPGEGMIKPESLAVLVVVTGLRGVERVGIRHEIRPAFESAGLLALEEFEHDPESDEHNFVYARTDLVFEEPGGYALDVEVAAGKDTLHATYEFAVERMQ